MQSRPMFCSAVAAAIVLAGACAPSVPPSEPAPQPTTAVEAGAPLFGPVPTPESYLGLPVGADRTLADWGEITGYMAAVAEASPRVALDTLGPTTLGRPFVMLTIASPETLVNLEEYRRIQLRLADPRTIADEAEAERLVSRGKTIVLITASIHSTEVGASQVPMRIVHRLAASDDPAVRKILDNTIVLLVPSLNPDGVDLVVDWYEDTLGEVWEGAYPPFLYHHYVGHDNNRDWYAFTQQETRLAVEYAHNAWHPQIVHDIHQQGARGARFFIPPWIDPVEPNVDPLLVEGINDLGTHMAWRMGMQGFTGIVVNATYDAWTPARAYQHYHGGVRILTETASARLATPVTIPFDSLRQGRNFHPRRRSWNFPEPWPGGEWRLGDIVDYMEAGAFALLEHAAENREAWLRSFLRIGEKAVAGWDRWPEAWLIPAEQENEAGVQELLRILTTADVEVHRAEEPFRADGRRYPAGTYVVSMHQPYASFAQTVLERQEYPDLRLYPGGPPRRPYDVTAHTLPLLLGVEAHAAREVSAGPDGLALSTPVATPEVETVAEGLSGAEPNGRTVPRVALYQSYAPSMDEGWTRWIFDRYRIPYETVHDADIRAGGLGDRYDVVVLPAQGPRTLYYGRSPGTVPERYAGGLGAEGTAALAAFVRGGGTLVTLEEASRYAMEYLKLPVRDRLEGLDPEAFYIPGSILRLELEAGHGLTRGMADRSIAWFGRDGMAFEPTAPEVRIIGRYGADRPLLSGWALGQSHVASTGAIAEVRLGRGRVVLFGFRPQYRGQSMATFPLLFNALRLPVGATAAAP